jgi:hypothetical protein
MYLFDWLARISTGIGLLLVFVGGMSGFTNSDIIGFGSIINYFLVANTFFLITIILFLHNIKHKKD